MYAPHHTISHKHTHTHPKSGKQVKTDENSSPTGRRWYTLRERPRQRHDVARQSRKTRSRTSTHTSPSCIHFTYFLTYIGWREHGTIQPVWRSLRIQYHFILNKTSYTSYATEHFVCPHQLRFHNSLSTQPTSCFMVMLSVSTFMLHALFHVHWLERTKHHPASVTIISSHSVSLHDFMLNKTSYATEYFVCPHQLRFHNSLSC